MEDMVAAQVFQDLPSDQLIDHALRNREGVICKNGALCVLTGARTGRSPKDRFIVCDAVTKARVDWGVVNQPMTPEVFEALWNKATAFIEERSSYVAHLHVGADDRYALPVRVQTESAWHNLFARNLFLRPTQFNPQNHPIWRILNAPSLKTDPAVDGTHSEAAVVIDLNGRRVLLGGMRYAGEMKKAMFSVLNYLLPELDVLPMHCAANADEHGNVALFFGLSGTGKTTLSADPDRFLIGDDEHGWARDAVFNFEGGCYAKCINLSQEREPVIWDAISHGAIMENVKLDGNNAPNYDDDTITQNSRAAYPLEHIGKRVLENKGRTPQAVIFLTCDLYGVLPPVARLTDEQAAYHFLSGYTALVGSTEVGSSSAIKSTFSTCFGAPFFPRPAQVYADLLLKRVREANCPVYLVNTGWTGGPYGIGKRFDIPVTRAVVSAILRGDLARQSFSTLPGFNLQIPAAIPGVDVKLLNPKDCWQDTKLYQQKLNELIERFRDNFERFNVTDNIKQAGPRPI